MFGIHDIPDYVAEPGWYTCGRCGKQERRVDWHNLEIRGSMIYRNNMGEVVTKYLADIEKIRKATEAQKTAPSGENTRHD
jgi:hypothetical protein